MRTSRFTPNLTWLDIRAHVTTIGVALAVVAASVAVAPNICGVLAAGFALVVIAIAIIDARYLIIPDELNLMGLGLGLAHAWFAQSALIHAGLADQSAFEATGFAMLRGVVLAVIFLAVRAAYQRLRGRQGIGLGDVKLAAVAGVWLNWQMMPIAVDIAAVTAIGVYLTRQLVLGRSIRSTGRLPFGLFFAPAIWLGWILDQWLIMP